MFKGVDLKIQNIESGNFMEYFDKVLSPGNNINGKIIVKFDVTSLVLEKEKPKL